MTIESFAVPGKVALYLEDSTLPEADFSSDKGDTIGVRTTGHNGGGSAFYISAAPAWTGFCARVWKAACLLFDGTVHTNEQMIAAALETRPARACDIWQCRRNGLAGLASVKIGRRVFIHINNTNPVLDGNSPEHAAVKAMGWEVAHDGMR
ncbi:hypothetical protein NKH52_15815 [Mesorhizobium sp. M1066]|uniref:hypothetical protein n=1 Tax=unclassified Mesorhizobium TaxID=325217 RepID=UPI00333A8BD2